MKRTLFVELNEFNFALAKEAVNRFHLPCLAKILSWHHSETWSDDTYESDFLEPWVQWVSVHTETSSSEHRVKHLGDVPHLEQKQFWQVLSEQKISSGIWGAMNASRAQSEHTLFFLPDPWTVSEKAFPQELDDLSQFLKWIATNYTHKTASDFVLHLKNLFRFLKKRKNLVFFLKGLPSLIYNSLKFFKKPFVFVSYLDDLSSHLFLSYVKEHSPQFSLLFLNSLAHLQHHQWKDRPLSLSDPLAHGFFSLEKSLQAIFAEFSDEDQIIVANALSQMNTAKEEPWILYRQIDHKKFLRAVGILEVEVQAHMTHDAHLLFPSQKEMQQAKILLESATLHGKKLFHVECYSHEPNKLFYKIVYTDQADHTSELSVQGKTLPFLSLFKKIVQRSGKHIQRGDVLSNQPIFPKRLKNHEIFSFVLPSKPLTREQYASLQTERT